MLKYNRIDERYSLHKLTIADLMDWSALEKQMVSSSHQTIQISFSQFGNTAVFPA